MKIQINKHIILIYLTCLVFGCSPKIQETQDSNYLRWVDDIPFDPSLDNEEFEICYGDNRVRQYFNSSQGLEYEGEKYAIQKAFKENYNSEVVPEESGLIRVRFIVNCKGETDRFRIIAMDENYHQKEFNPVIVTQILNISKGLNGWNPKILRGRNIDYYQYLIFKIEQGKIIKILP